MAEDDKAVENVARERMRRTDTEVHGNILPGTVAGKLTENGLDKLIDGLKLDKIKFARE